MFLVKVISNFVLRLAFLLFFLRFRRDDGSEAGVKGRARFGS